MTQRRRGWAARATPGIAGHPASNGSNGAGREHAETRRFGRSAGMLAGGIGLAGVLTYGYFALASHQLDAQSYGEIVVLWSATFVAISTLYRPVEQLLSRTIAEREACGAPTAATLRIAALIQGAIALLCVIAALALRGPLEDELLSGNGTLYWILVASLGAYAGNFFARGFLAGRHRFGLLARLLLFEAGARFGLALVVAIGITNGQTVIALGVAAGPLASLLVVPFALRRSRRPVRTATARDGEGAMTLGRGSDFALAVFLIMLGEQILLNAGPLLVQISAGAVAAGFIFNVLMVARAPLLLFQGVAMSLLPHLTRLRSNAGERSDDFSHSIRATLTVIAAFTGLAVLVILVAGPPLMEIAFGGEYEYDRVGLLLVGLSIGPYLTATTLNQAALARGQVRRAAVCWVAAAVVFVGWNLSGALDEFRRVEVGFLVCASALALMLYALYRSSHVRAEDIVLPDSPAEVEARLAAAEEAA